MSRIARRITSRKVEASQVAGINIVTVTLNDANGSELGQATFRQSTANKKATYAMLPTFLNKDERVVVLMYVEGRLRRDAANMELKALADIGNGGEQLAQAMKPVPVAVPVAPSLAHTVHKLAGANDGEPVQVNFGGDAVLASMGLSRQPVIATPAAPVVQPAQTGDEIAAPGFADFAAMFADEQAQAKTPAPRRRRKGVKSAEEKVEDALMAHITEKGVSWTLARFAQAIVDTAQGHDNRACMEEAAAGLIRLAKYVEC